MPNTKLSKIYKIPFVEYDPYEYDYSGNPIHPFYDHGLLVGHWKGSKFIESHMFGMTIMRKIHLMARGDLLPPFQ